MDITKDLHEKSHCEACGRQWLGSYWNKPFCTECEMEIAADEHMKHREMPSEEEINEMAEHV